MERLCAEHGYQHSDRTGELFHAGQVSGCPDDWVVKVMPDQVSDWRDFATNFIGRAEQIYYTLRRDFGAQYNSWILANLSHQWHPSHIEPHGCIQGEQVSIRLRHDQAAFDVLMHNFLNQRALWHRHGGEVVWLEDVAHQPYQKAIVASEPLEVPHVDLEMLWQNPEIMP